jgi:hypothetical protein
MRHVRLDDTKRVVEIFSEPREDLRRRYVRHLMTSCLESIGTKTVPTGTNRRISQAQAWGNSFLLPP